MLRPKSFAQSIRLTLIAVTGLALWLSSSGGKHEHESPVEAARSDSSAQHTAPGIKPDGSSLALGGDCSGCGATSANADSGSVSSCSGTIQISTSITDHDGDCIQDPPKTGCIQKVACFFRIVVSWTSTCTFDLTGRICGVPITPVTNIPSGPGGQLFTQFLDCDSDCGYTFTAKCNGCSTGPTISNGLNCKKCGK